MRIAKDGEVRKQELLNAALDLFAEKGYDKTSVNDIIGKVGVTKGAFYYYFTSKEQVLDEIVGTFNEYDALIFREVAAEQLNALEKIVQMNLKGFEFIIGNPEIAWKSWLALMSVGNSKLKHKHGENTRKIFLPIFLGVIEQGIKEKYFDVPVVDETAELMLSMYTSMCYRMTKQCSDRVKQLNCQSSIKKMLLFYQDTLEKILGARKGSINLLALLEGKI